jgi:hypothetical protein
METRSRQAAHVGLINLDPEAGVGGKVHDTVAHERRKVRRIFG